MPRFIPSDRHVLGFHLVFAALASAALLAPVETPSGVRIFLLVVFYNMALPLAAHQLDHRRWIRIWLFLVPVSAFQVLPDAFLAARLEVLVFPNLGGPRLGPVPAAMAGMWTIPLFLVLYLGERCLAEKNLSTALGAVAVASAVLFVGAEATLWAVPIWYAQGVHTVGHVALYVIVPEILLGLAAFIACEELADRHPTLQVLAAFCVSTFYLGALGISHLLVEGALRSAWG